MRQLGNFGSEGVGPVDEDELLCSQRLKNLYTSTRAAKVSLNDTLLKFISLNSFCGLLI